MSPPLWTVPGALVLEKEFILTLKTLPVLWNKTHPQYVNQYWRYEALEQLLAVYRKSKPEATVLDVKRKINTLRSNYRRELRKIKLSMRPEADPANVYVPKIWTFKHLRFLDKSGEPVDRDFTYDDTDDELDRSRPTRPKTDSTDMYPMENIHLLKESPSPPPPPLPSRSPKMNAPMNLNKTSNPTCPYYANHDTIACYWSDTLNRLEPTQRLYAKKAINDILFEAEMGNLNRYSVRINEPGPCFYKASPEYPRALVTPPSASSSFSDVPVSVPISGSMIKIESEPHMKTDDLDARACLFPVESDSEDD